MRDDIAYLSRVMRGGMSSSPHDEHMLTELAEGRVPQEWCADGFPTSKVILEWAAQLKPR